MSGRKDEQYWNDVYTDLEVSAPSYDGWLDKYIPLIEAAGDVPIIDLGCGIGGDTQYLTEHGRSVIACDFSQEALDRIARLLPGCETRRFDMTQGLPFEDGAAKLIVADLSLHYFRWDVTVQIVRDIARVIGPGGALLARLNSVRDVHYGAGAGTEVEPHYYEHKGRRKRFFDEADISRLFAEWNVMSLQETEMGRYGKPKRCWELAAMPPLRASLHP
ncbi:class I SAM-dependent methyltransferase [Paenibacillus chartarius]|uniref:Class I SAM-dependent methyltransferase n=1 Tax=Paenibacillus chartarius TaxID=747481 RepID=A0ABV6DPW8_9BACL